MAAPSVLMDVFLVDCISRPVILVLAAPVVTRDGGTLLGRDLLSTERGDVIAVAFGGVAVLGNRWLYAESARGYELRTSPCGHEEWR